MSSGELDKRIEKGKAYSKPGGWKEYAEDPRQTGLSLDLNEQLIRNKKETFFFRMKGDSMKYAGIFDKDILVVDRGIRSLSGKLVIASFNGELVVRRIKYASENIILETGNALFKNEQVHVDADFEVWGVITYVIHSYY